MNLEWLISKIKALCRADCADATTLAAVVAKGPPVTTAQVTTPATPPTE